MANPDIFIVITNNRIAVVVRSPSFTVKLALESVSIIKIPFPFDPTQSLESLSSVMVNIPLLEFKGN